MGGERNLYEELKGDRTVGEMERRIISLIAMELSEGMGKLSYLGVDPRTINSQFNRVIIGIKDSIALANGAGDVLKDLRKTAAEYCSDMVDVYLTATIGEVKNGNTKNSE